MLRPWSGFGSGTIGDPARPTRGACLLRSERPVAARAACTGTHPKPLFSILFFQKDNASPPPTLHHQHHDVKRGNKTRRQGHKSTSAPGRWPTLHRDGPRCPRFATAACSAAPRSRMVIRRRTPAIAGARRSSHVPRVMKTQTPGYLHMIRHFAPFMLLSHSPLAMSMRDSRPGFVRRLRSLRAAAAPARRNVVSFQNTRTYEKPAASRRQIVGLCLHGS